MKFGFKQLPNIHLIYLLIAIIAFLVINPFFHEVGQEWVSTVFAGLLIPLLAVLIVADHKINLIIATALAVPLVIFSWLSRFEPTTILVLVRLSLATAFYGFAVYMVLHNIHKREVTIDVIVGSVASYLLIGIMWAYLYQLIQFVQPGSLVSTIAIETGSANIDVVYYSFSVLTTLGFGDIVPATAIARSFTSLEAVTGVLFMALVIARVIGIYAAKKGLVLDVIKKN